MPSLLVARASGGAGFGQLRDPRREPGQVLGLQPVVWVGLNEEGRRSLRSALRRPSMVEAGEVVVDPDGGGVAQPGVDLVTLPQVAVGVAGGDLRAGDRRTTGLEGRGPGR